MANSQKETIATVRLLVIEFGGLCKKEWSFVELLVYIVFLGLRFH